MKADLCKHFVGAALLALGFVDGPALAASMPQPGSWKTTIATERDGAVRSVQVTTSCLTAKELRAPEMGIAPKASELRGYCKRVNFKKTNDGLTWDIECRSKAALIVKSAIVFDSAKHFIGVIQVSLSSEPNTRAFAATKKIDAQRIGECKR